MPIMKSVGRTVFGVRMGCHAFRRCCLKAVSTIQLEIPGETAGVGGVGRTGWPPPALFIFLSLGGISRVGSWLVSASEESHGRNEGGERTGGSEVGKGREMERWRPVGDTATAARLTKTRDGQGKPIINI